MTVLARQSRTCWWLQGLWGRGLDLACPARVDPKSPEEKSSCSMPLGLGPRGSEFGAAQPPSSPGDPAQNLRRQLLCGWWPSLARAWNPWFCASSFPKVGLSPLHRATRLYSRCHPSGVFVQTLKREEEHREEAPGPQGAGCWQVTCAEVEIPVAS